MAKRKLPFDELDIPVPVVHSIPCSGDAVRILPLSDLHIGDRNCDMKLVKRLISRVADDDDCYTLLAGDLCNTAVAGGKSDSYHEQLTPGEQARRVAELLRPVAHKVLAVVPGNHEERIDKLGGLSMTELITDILGIHDLYRATSALVYISVGDGKHAPHGRPPMYSVYVNHGHGGGGRRAGSKINCLEDLGFNIDADLLLAGHTHLPAVFRSSHLRCCPQNKTAEMHEQVFVNMASTLKYCGSYGDRGGYKPNSRRYPLISLETSRRYISVTL